jgi:hypothetical protein
MADPFDTEFAKELANFQRLLDDDGRETAPQGEAAKRPSAGSGASPPDLGMFYNRRGLKGAAITLAAPFVAGYNILAGAAKGADALMRYGYQPGADDGSRERQIENALDAGGLAAGSVLPMSAARVGNTLGTFGGRLAKTADHVVQGKAASASPGEKVTGASGELARLREGPPNQPLRTQSLFDADAQALFKQPPKWFDDYHGTLWNLHTRDLVKAGSEQEFSSLLQRLRNDKNITAVDAHEIADTFHEAARAKLHPSNSMGDDAFKNPVIADRFNRIELEIFKKQRGDPDFVPHPNSHWWEGTPPGFKEKYASASPGEKVTPAERPVEAAIKYKGEVYTGSNHVRIMDDLDRRFGRTSVDDMADGFVTSSGRFVSRDEASKLTGKQEPFDWNDLRSDDAAASIRNGVQVQRRGDLGGEAKDAKALKSTLGLPVPSSDQKERPMAEQGTDFESALLEFERLLAEGGADDGTGGGGVDAPRTVSNPTQTLGGRRMEGRRPMTVQERTMLENPALQMGRDAGALASSAVNALGLGLPGVALDYAAPDTMAAIRGNEELANFGVPFAGSVAGSSAIPVNKLAQGAEAIGRGISAMPAWAKYAGVGLPAMAMPGEAQQTTGSTGNPALDRMLDQQRELTAQRKAAQAERDLQVKGGGAIKGGRGPNYNKAQEELERLDVELGKLSTQIGTAQEGMTPAAKLKAERDRAAFEETERAKEFGKPIREYLPPALANSVPIIATGAGILATRGITGKFNAEYNAALNGYRTAEKAGDVAEMALRRAQLAKLEETTVGNTLPTVLAAGLPAEIRLTETAIDANRDPHSRAYTEAWDRIKDPAAMAFDVGTAALSSGVAYGLGSKFAKNPPERSLGQAIVTPYHKNAISLSDDVANVPKNRLAGPEPIALEPLSPTPTRPSLQGPEPATSPLSTRTGTGAEGQSQGGLPQGSTEAQRLADRIRQNPVPPSSRPQSNRPDWASDPPQGVDLKKGQLWHTGMQRIKNADGTWADHPKYSTKGRKKEGNPRSEDE